MSCPTCDHTMQCVGNLSELPGYFWCPRCGTLQAYSPGGHVDTEAPKLVERCREFQMQLRVSKGLGSKLDQLGTWCTLGIEESINKPEDRRE